MTLVDGKAHSVDSSDMAFQTAGALALRDAAGQAKPALLEPVDAVEITLSDEFVGAVLGDLCGRRGRVLGTEPVSNGRTLVRAEVPATGLARYPVELRSLSHGTGQFTRGLPAARAMPRASPPRSSRPRRSEGAARALGRGLYPCAHPELSSRPVPACSSLATAEIAGRRRRTRPPDPSRVLHPPPAPRPPPTTFPAIHPSISPDTPFSSVHCCVFRRTHGIRLGLMESEILFGL